MKRVILQPWREPNPQCFCGCGQEVRLPCNRFILGHSGQRKAPHGWQVRAVAMWKRGWQYKEIADYFGVSKSRVNIVIGDHIFMENRPEFLKEFHRKNDIEKAIRYVIFRKPTVAEQKQIEEEEAWITARKEHSKVKVYLRNLNRSHSQNGESERELILLT